MNSKKAAAAAWAAIAALCLVYGPMAIEYMWRFFTPGAPALWDHVFAGVVGQGMAEGDGSIHHEQQNVYAASRVLLLVHTMGGGFAIMLAVAQFSRRLRARRPALHRALGRVQVAVVVVSMLTAMAYLVRTGPDGTFDGPAFYVQLWALAIGTLVSSVLAVAAIVRGQVRMHQCLMALNLAMLLTAPLLRVGYLTLGLAWPDQTQEVTNLAGAAMLGSLVFVGAIVASRHFDTRSPGRSHSPITLHPSLGRLIWAASVVSLIGVAVEFDRLGGEVDRVVGSYLVTAAGALALFSAMEIRTRRAGKDLAAGEWRVHQLGLAAAPIAFAALWPLFATVWSPSQGFYAALLTATAFTMNLGLFAAIWGRRNRSSNPNLAAQKVSAS